MTYIVAVDVQVTEVLFRDSLDTTVAVVHALDIIAAN